MVVMFDELMKPLMQNAIGGEEMNEDMMKQRLEKTMSNND